MGPAAPFHVHLGSCQESFRCSPKGQTCSLGSAAGQTPPFHLLLRNTAQKCQAAWRRGDVSAMPGHLHACHEEMVKVAGNAHVGREPQGVPALGSWARAAARPLRQAGARPAARRSALEPRQAPGGSWVLSQPCHTSGVPFPKAPPAPGLCSALPGRPPLSSPSASQTRRSSKAELVAFIPHPGALPGAWHRVGVQSIFVQSTQDTSLSSALGADEQPSPEVLLIICWRLGRSHPRGHQRRGCWIGKEGQPGDRSLACSHYRASVFSSAE